MLHSRTDHGRFHAPLSRASGSDTDAALGEFRRFNGKTATRRKGRTTASVRGQQVTCSQRPLTELQLTTQGCLLLASHAEEFHLRVLPKPCMNLSIHTASDVRLPTYKKRQCEKSVGLAQRTRANHSLAPQCRRRRRLNFQRAQRTR